MILGCFTYSMAKPVQPNLHLPKFPPTDGRDDANQKSLLELQGPHYERELREGVCYVRLKGECQEAVMQKLSVCFLTWFMF